MTNQDNQAEPPKARRGGKRPGAGRPRKAKPATEVAEIDIEALLSDAPPASIDRAAAAHGGQVLAALVRAMRFGKSEPARVAAAVTILDRGYGKPSADTGSAVVASAQLELIPASGLEVTATAVEAEARRWGRVAVEVLRRLAEFAVSESARVAAARALLDRGYGSAPTARLPDDLRAPGAVSAPGKKELARAAAKTAATGKYAPPPPPTPPTAREHEREPGKDRS